MSLNTNKKSIFFFVLFTFLGGLAGACSVIFSKYFDLSNIKPSALCFKVMFFSGATITILGILLVLFSTFKIKSTLNKNSNIDEYSLDTKSHTNLTIMISVPTLLNVFTLGWTSTLIIYLEKFTIIDSSIPLIVYIIIAAILTIISASLSIISFKFYNKIYKTRQLDALSTNLSNDAFNILDEGERQTAYKSAFKAFKVIDTLMLLTIILLMIFGLLLNIDTILPIIIVTILLIINKSIYFIEVYKLEKSN
ncbi:MAG: DUF3169 family protein [Clostridium sp.]